MRYCFEATEINRDIDQLKPGLKSMAQYFIYVFFYLKRVLGTCAYMQVHNECILCLLHTQGCAATHKNIQIFNTN